MNNNPPRYIGDPDFHDGYVRGVSWNDDKMVVAVVGYSGKRYIVAFDGVLSVESYLPMDMMLYALSEIDAEIPSLRRYDFINWYCDEPDQIESKAHLRIMANSFTVAESD